MADNAVFWATLFWLSALLDGMTIYWAVLPHSGTLAHKVNPFLAGSSWTYFFIFLVLLHGAFQIWFSVVWKRRQTIEDIVSPMVDMAEFSAAMAKRFISVILPDEAQLVYTGITLYIAVTTAHLLAAANNSLVALGRPGGFALLARVVAWTAPGLSPQERHSLSICFFYLIATITGVGLANLWFVWRIRRRHEGAAGMFLPFVG